MFEGREHFFRETRNESSSDKAQQYSEKMPHLTPHWHAGEPKQPWLSSSGGLILELKPDPACACKPVRLLLARHIFLLETFDAAIPEKPLNCSV